MSHHLVEEGDESTPLIMANTGEDSPSPFLVRREEVHSHHRPAAGDPHQPPASTATDLQPGLDMEDVMYSANSFWAVMKPVALTMFLASIVVVNMDFGTATGSDNQGMSVYQVNDGDGNGGGDSNSVKLGKSLANAFAIVGGICVATFIVACLYRFRCMKVLVGYMGFSCIMLLGLMGGLLWHTALVRWSLPCDSFTFFFTLYNFAVVGVTAIFYQKGIPMVVTQSYLVAISVIMAWQLSRFEEWTGWCLLVVLALYDLCAVLTPCGPLKYLVGLMQEYNEPMPGLLYEAELPGPHNMNGAAAASNGNGQTAATRAPAGARRLASPVDGIAAGGAPIPLAPMHAASSSVGAGREAGGAGGVMTGDGGGGEDGALPLVNGSVGSPPREPRVARPAPDTPENESPPRDATPLLRARHPVPHHPNHHHQLHQDGGSSSGLAASGEGAGEARPSRRVPHHSEEGDEEDDEAAREERSIKLGLGDFVFYSVLVSKAALYGFATCAACFLVIITGLGATLVLLSVFRKALPALPISIGLGVLFYLLTRLVIIPYIANLASHPLYV